MRRGEAVALVTATGAATYFGRAAELVRVAHVESAEMKAVLGLVRNLSVVNAAIVVLLVAYAHVIALPASQIIQLVLTAMLSAVPVALPATFTLAAALGGEVCEIYTDVAGVFTADPRIVSDARKLSMVSYEEMLEMASSGAKVLQLRSVEYARNHGVRIHCRSSFEDAPGTVVLGETETMEQPLITAVTHSTSEARITLTAVPDEPGAAARRRRAASAGRSVCR